MKFSSASLLILAAPLANAAGFSIFDPTQTSLNAGVTEDFPVEGDNPLIYCAKPDSYKLKIESVDLTPNPPLPYVNHQLFLFQKSRIFAYLDRTSQGTQVNDLR